LLLCCSVVASLSSCSLPLALDDVDLRIEARERVGICGRTGSGKSTMTMILFRMVRKTVLTFPQHFCQYEMISVYHQDRLGANKTQGVVIEKEEHCVARLCHR
jgi:ABC-type glutathione transport system ATPase component